jgi:hypothetical protein
MDIKMVVVKLLIVHPQETERVIQDQHVHGGYQKYLFKWRGILVF